MSNTVQLTTDYDIDEVLDQVNMSDAIEHYGAEEVLVEMMQENSKTFMELLLDEDYLEMLISNCIELKGLDFVLRKFPSLKDVAKTSLKILHAARLEEKRKEDTQAAWDRVDHFVESV